MSEFLGGDLDFDLDDIIDPEDVNVNDKKDDQGKEDKKETSSTSDGKENNNTDGKEDDDSDKIIIDETGNEVSSDDTDDNSDDKGDDDKKDTEEGTDDDESSSSSDDTIAAYASALYEEGAFPDIDKEEIEKVKSVEDLVAINRKQIEANELKDLSPEQREALNAFRNGFSVDEFKYMKSQELQYDSIKDEDLDNEEVAETIVKNYLSMTNTDESVSKDLIESYKVDEKLKDKAKAYLPKIKDAIKKRNEEAIKTREKQKEDTIKQIKSGLDSTKEVFKGINLTEKEKQDLYNQMTTPAKVLEDGTQLDAVMAKRMEDPIGFMIKLHYYAAKGLFDKEPNTEFLQTKEKTKALSKLEEKLSKGNSSNRMSGSRKTSDSDLYNFDDIPDVNINF